MKSQFLKKWVMIQLSGEEGYFKAYIEKIGMEGDVVSYFVKYEDGTKEIIFLNSVHRIWVADQKKGKLLPLKIDNKLRLVKD
jgi:hypothetical protein